METIASLTARFPHPGRLDWIGLRPARNAGMQVVAQARVTPAGLTGDRHPNPGKRAVTLFQAEHLPVLAALTRQARIDPASLRRNLVISGLNLSATRGRILHIGSAHLRVTGPCAPCSKMETALGPGAYNAMRGHGGWTAEVVTQGQITTGDKVTVLP
jgi:MOSC domain-containing protein YiiM